MAVLLHKVVSVIYKDSFTLLSTFRVKTSSEIRDILYDSPTTTLYIAAGYDSKSSSGGLQIYSLTDPSAPVLTAAYYKSTAYPGSLSTTDSFGNTVGSPVTDIDARGLGLFNGILFLADNFYGLRVLDVKTDPSHPYEVPLTTQTDNCKSGYAQPNVSGSYITTGGYIGLSIYPYNNKVYAFVLDFYHGVKVFDITDPAAIADPILKNTLSSIWLGSVSLLSDLFATVTGDRLTAYVVGGDSDDSEFILSRLDVNFSTDSPITNFGYCTLPDVTRGLYINGDYAYVADSSSGLQIVNISNVPSSSSEVLKYPIVGTYTTHADFSYSVFLDGAALYLATGESGLIKLDVSNATNPTFTATLDSPLSADDICISGDFTYMLDRKKGLRIFNTVEPSYPELRGYVDNTDPATDLCVSGNYAYISKASGHVNIIDISDPDSPSVTNTSISSSSPNALAVSGNYLYISDSNSGLHVIDITNPLVPVDKGSTATLGPPVSVTIFNGRAYIAEGNSGLEIMDVTNPDSPVSIGHAAMIDAKATAIYNSGESIYAFVADGSSGLVILNVSNVNSLSDPVIFNKMNNSTTPSPFTAVSVTTINDYAFVSMGKDGILALDISNPLTPDIISHYRSSSYSSDLAATSIYKAAYNSNTTYVTVADGNTGMKTLYIYEASSDDGDDTFKPSIDSGCYIDTSIHGKHKGWISVIITFLNQFI